MTIIEFIENNLVLDSPVLTAISLTIIFLLCYDLYHSLFSVILTWFKK